MKKINEALKEFCEPNVECTDVVLTEKQFRRIAKALRLLQAFEELTADIYFGSSSCAYGASACGDRAKHRFANELRDAMEGNDNE